MARTIGLVVAAFLLAQPSRDQPPTHATESRIATGAIRGRVLTAAAHDPIRNARVVAAGERDSPPVLTDADGRFAITGLPAGAFRVTAGKSGFAEAAAGATAPGLPGRRIAVAAGQVVDDVTIELRRGSAISGLVADSYGEPIAGASVIVERAGAEAGTVPIRVGMTDDLGQYRIGSLAEGRVLVSVFSSPRDVVMLPNGGIMYGAPGNLGDRIYYPGATSRNQGEPIALEPGDEKRGVDFAVATKRIVGPHVQPVHDLTVVGGRVISSEGRGIPAAQVALLVTEPADMVRHFAITDGDGAFQFTLPPQGGATFRISVQRAGYLPAAYGQRSATDIGDEVTVAPRESRTDLDVTLRRPAAIVGTLFDENGDPVEGAIVGAFTVQTVAGQQRLAGARTVPRPTDDLGRYRLAGLVPGEYMLAAFVGQIIGVEASVGLPGYATTFFPGTAVAAEGRQVAVGASQDLSGVDFSLVRVKTARISGRAFDAAGDPITGGIALMPSRRSGAILPTVGARIDRDGRFEFTSVAPGEYVVQASRHRQGAWNEGESALQFVTVSGDDVTDLELHTSIGSTIAGRIICDDRVVKVGQLELSAIPVDPDLSPTIAGPPARALIGDDLTFELAGLRGPRRLRVTRVPTGLALESIRLNGADVTDAVFPLGRGEQSLADVEIVLSTHVTEVSGAVDDGKGHVVDGAAVVVFPADPERRYAGSRFVASTSADRLGRYRFEALPPADYYLAAADRSRLNLSRELGDPDFLESLVPAATRVLLGEAAHVTVAIRVAER